MAAKCSCRLQAFAHLQASQDGTYGPLPNNTNRGDSDGMLFSGLPRPNYSSGPSLAP